MAKLAVFAPTLFSLLALTACVPLTGVEQQRAAEEAKRQGVMVCEVFAGRRDCRRVSQQELDWILNR